MHSCQLGIGVESSPPRTALKAETASMFLNTIATAHCNGCKASN
jgi:hypothetical protein